VPRQLSELGEITRFLYPRLISHKLRLRRFRLFLDLIETLPRPLSILDVGGTWQFWRDMGLAGRTEISILLLNRYAVSSPYTNLTSVAGDARHMPHFADQSFDIVFSNSVIEHVGSYADQQCMASEVRRIGRRYFVQTPNRFFPLEPHFLFPGFQFLPLAWRIGLAYHLRLGWASRQREWQTVVAEVSEIRLLTAREFRALFPEAVQVKETLLGLTKSFTAYAGFSAPACAAWLLPPRNCRR
jgi:hypothetical protein